MIRPDFFRGIFQEINRNYRNNKSTNDRIKPKFQQIKFIKNFLKDDAKWREKEVTMILKVPEGKSIYLNNKMKDIIYDIQNTENMWDGDMVGKKWIMTANGLALKQSAPVVNN